MQILAKRNLYNYSMFQTNFLVVGIRSVVAGNDDGHGGGERSFERKGAGMNMLR